jgi:hypothetical protein
LSLEAGLAFLLFAVELLVVSSPSTDGFALLVFVIVCGQSIVAEQD